MSMYLHLRVPKTLDDTFCGQRGPGSGIVPAYYVYQVAIDMICRVCLLEMQAAYPQGVKEDMKPGEALEKVTNEAEKPNKYSILQSDQGRWQILQRSEGAGYWIVTVKDCGSMRMATLLLNAIITGAKPGTREHEILNASNK